MMTKEGFPWKNCTTVSASSWTGIGLDLFNEAESEDWEPAWSPRGATGIATRRGDLLVAYAHVTDGECDDITLFGTEYVGHDTDYDNHIDITEAFDDHENGGYLRSCGTEEDWEQLINDIAELLEK